MTREDILRSMAKIPDNSGPITPAYLLHPEMLDALIAEAVAAEREACAKLVVSLQEEEPDDGINGWMVAAAIRARGQQ